MGVAHCITRRALHGFLPFPAASAPVKLLIDLFPVLAFFGVFRVARAFPDVTAALLLPLVGSVQASPELARELPAVMAATLGAILATLVQVAWLHLARHRIRPVVWISAGIVIVFGALTIWLQNEWFIKWKPSILDWTFAGILAGGRLFAGRNLLGSLLGEELELPPVAWERLLWAWTAFFFVLGAANLVVAYNFSTDAWVDFKTFGMMGMTFAFSIGTGLYLMRFMKADENA
jgi:intracellular septation protein